LVQSVKVEGKNAEAEFEDVRVFYGLIGDTWHVEWTEPQMLH
jgi:hypothetical protein